MVHLKELHEYTADLEKLYQIMRGMNHDYKNLFSTAYSFIDTGDLDGLRAFYSKSLARFSVEFDTSNNYPIITVSMDTTDIVRILGIYLDNAIESALTTSIKEVFIYFSK